MACFPHQHHHDHDSVIEQLVFEIFKAYMSWSEKLDFSAAAATTAMPLLRPWMVALWFMMEDFCACACICVRGEKHVCALLIKFMWHEHCFSDAHITNLRRERSGLGIYMQA